MPRNCRTRVRPGDVIVQVGPAPGRGCGCPRGRSRLPPPRTGPRRHRCGGSRLGSAWHLGRRCRLGRGRARGYRAARSDRGWPRRRSARAGNGGGRAPPSGPCSTALVRAGARGVPRTERRPVGDVGPRVRSLLVAFDSAHAAATEALAARGHAVATIGMAEVGRGVHDTSERSIPWPPVTR